jgi:hypothetical protein
MLKIGKREREVIYIISLTTDLINVLECVRRSILNRNNILLWNYDNGQVNFSILLVRGMEKKSMWIEGNGKFQFLFKCSSWWRKLVTCLSHKCLISDNLFKLTQSEKFNLASSCREDCASALIRSVSASLVKTFDKNTRSSTLSVANARHTAR